MVKETSVQPRDLRKLSGVLIDAFTVPLDEIKDALFSEISGSTGEVKATIHPESLKEIRVLLQDDTLVDSMRVRITIARRPDIRKEWLVKGNLTHFGGCEYEESYSVLGFYDPETHGWIIDNGFLHRGRIQ